MVSRTLVPPGTENSGRLRGWVRLCGPKPDNSEPGYSGKRRQAGATGQEGLLFLQGCLGALTSTSAFTTLTAKQQLRAR